MNENKPFYVITKAGSIIGAGKRAEVISTGRDTYLILRVAQNNNVGWGKHGKMRSTRPMTLWLRAEEFDRENA